MKRIVCVIAGLIFFAGCEKPIDLGERSYMGATRIGDGLLVELNKNHIAMHLEGKMKGTAISGTMVPISDHKNIAFKLKERPDMLIMLSPDDLIVIKEKEGMKFGAALARARSAYEPADVAGIYNVVAQYHSENQNKFGFGTFELGLDHSWRSWRFADGLESNEQPIVNGYWHDNGQGKIHAFTPDHKLCGTVILNKKSNLMIINMLGKNGLSLGVRREFLEPGSINGDYVIFESEHFGIKNGHLTDDVIIKMSADQRIDNSKDANKKLNLTYNKPWPGFVSTQQGELLGICSRETCFVLNMGPLTGKQFLVAAVRTK